MLYLSVFFIFFSCCGLQADFLWGSDSGSFFETHISIQSQADNISLELSVPGFSKDQIKVSYTDNGLLCVQVKNKAEAQNKNDKKAACGEQKFTPVFSRRFPRLCKKNIQSCSAKAKDGILSINIELKEEETHQIKVES